MFMVFLRQRVPIQTMRRSAANKKSTQSRLTSSSVRLPPCSDEFNEMILGETARSLFGCGMSEWRPGGCGSPQWRAKSGQIPLRLIQPQQQQSDPKSTSWRSPLGEGHASYVYGRKCALSDFQRPTTMAATALGFSNRYTFGRLGCHDIYLAGPNQPLRARNVDENVLITSVAAGNTGLNCAGALHFRCKCILDISALVLAR
ncbi:hypothetical protein BJ546DRAFT_594528 [Cryomyces antarcticus]